MSDRATLRPSTDELEPARRYSSTLRDEQARETRLRVLEAAQTAYASFANKRTILTRVMDLAIGSDEKPVGLLDREKHGRMRDEPNQRRQLHMFARGVREIMERTGPIFAVMQAAAAVEPEIAVVYKHLQEERLRNLTQVVGWIEVHGSLRKGLSTAEAADIIWTLASAEARNMLVIDRGWTDDQYQQWLEDALIAALLP